MTESFPMKGGDGAYSYLKNSLAQRQGVDHVKGMIREAIVEKLDIQRISQTSNVFVIADLGCSVGPNTFIAMQNVIEAIKDTYHTTQCRNSTTSCNNNNNNAIELQVFFNDLVNNDFNTLFESLVKEKQLYFAAAVPGSFYGRLFPTCSLHFAYSSYALNWLSDLPKELLDEKSPMWNKGRIYYGGANALIENAYVAQFEKDMQIFLSARAVEIVPGGLIVLILAAAASLGESPFGIFKFLESSLLDMVNQGFVDESLVDSFNLPVYAPSPQTMTKVVERNGCFSLERLELTNYISTINVKSAITHARASLEEIFNKQFGSNLTDEMFVRTFEKSEEISAWMRSEDYYKNARQLFVVLKHK